MPVMKAFITAKTLILTPAAEMKAILCLIWQAANHTGVTLPSVTLLHPRRLQAMMLGLCLLRRQLMPNTAADGMTVWVV
jgi:hypothetical protein